MKEKIMNELFTLKQIYQYNKEDKWKEGFDFALKEIEELVEKL